MDDRERELAEATAELSETLEALRAELEAPPEGPLGLPRPPSPGELLRFTEQHTIPATIALLEAAIRSLELLAAALRVADGRPIEAASGGTRSGTLAGDRLAATSRETLRRLDDALAELQSAARGDPSNPEVRRLLEEARGLRTEVDDRLSEAIEGDASQSERDRAAQSRGDEPETQPDRGTEPDRSSHAGPDHGTERDDAVGIDVDEELASIKRTVEDGSAGTDSGNGDVDATDDGEDQSPNEDR